MTDTASRLYSQSFSDKHLSIVLYDQILFLNNHYGNKKFKWSRGVKQPAEHREASNL